MEIKKFSSKRIKYMYCTCLSDRKLGLQGNHQAERMLALIKCSKNNKHAFIGIIDRSTYRDSHICLIILLVIITSSFIVFFF